MTAASANNRKPWGVAASDRTVGLEVTLRNRTFVLPWTQFLFAEGGDDDVRLAFTTHDVVVNGSGLGSLLADVSAQRVSQLREPVRAETFRSDGGPRITGISVRKVE